MKSSILLGASLCASAILIQAGCSAGASATQNPAGSGESARVQGGQIANALVLPEGTVLAVRTTNFLSTKTQKSGDIFSAHLEQPLLLAGRQIAPKGTEVEGTIVDSDEGGRVKGVASLTVRLTGLRLDGRMVDISTNTVTRHAQRTKKKDATKIAIGSGLGAVIGALAGGGHGAAIGAAAGGGAGTGVVLATHGDPSVISSESLLMFTLQAPVTVTLERR